MKKKILYLPKPVKKKKKKARGVSGCYIVTNLLCVWLNRSHWRLISTAASSLRGRVALIAVDEDKPRPSLERTRGPHKPQTSTLRTTG